MSMLNGARGSNLLPGVTVGVVSNNNDPEKLGRVKLQLPDRLGDLETDWARIAVPMAGKSMGLFYLPEVGDEVLVIFREGDLREPYVIGSLWNEKQKPPIDSDEGKNNIRLIKSRSGHEIIIDDTKDDGSVEIKVKNGSSLKISDKQSGVVTIKDKSGKNKAVFDGNGNKVEIKGDMKIELISGSSKVTIDSTKAAVEIKSDAKISLNAAQIEIKAGATLDLSSDGMVNIKGSMVKIN